MRIKELQESVDQWVVQHGGYWPPLSMLARLAEETGELARVLNQVYGMKKKKPEEGIGSIKDELGDILITSTCIANALSIDLETTLADTLAKMEERDSGNYKAKT